MKSGFWTLIKGMGFFVVGIFNENQVFRAASMLSLTTKYIKESLEMIVFAIIQPKRQKTCFEESKEQGNRVGNGC